MAENEILIIGASDSSSSESLAVPEHPAVPDQEPGLSAAPNLEQVPPEAPNQEAGAAPNQEPGPPEVPNQEAGEPAASNQEPGPSTASSESPQCSTNLKADASKTSEDKTKELPRYKTYMQTMIQESDVPTVPVVSEDELIDFSFRRAALKALKQFRDWMCLGIPLTLVIFCGTLLCLFLFGDMYDYRDWVSFSLIGLFTLLVIIFAVLTVLVVLNLRSQYQRAVAVTSISEVVSSTDATISVPESSTATISVPESSTPSEQLLAEDPGLRRRHCSGEIKESTV